MDEALHWWTVKGSFLILGIAAWRWSALIGCIFAALLASRLFELLAAQQIRTITRQLSPVFDRKLVGLSTSVIRWGILLIGARQGLTFLQLPPVWEKLAVGFFEVSYAIIFALLLSRFVSVLLELWVERAHDPSQLVQLKTSIVPALDKLSRLTIFAVMFLLILENAGFNVKSMLAGLGIGGLAVALGAQETLANLFGSITIFLDKPFRVGERIQIDKYDGSVERIGLRSTAVRQLNGTLVTIPNRQLAQSAINNVSRQAQLQHGSNLNLAANTSVEKIKEALKILRDIYARHPYVQSPAIFWKDFDAAAVIINIAYNCKDNNYNSYLETQEELNLEIKQRLEAAEIKFAYPSQAVYLRRSDK